MQPLPARVRAREGEAVNRTRTGARWSRAPREFPGASGARKSREAGSERVTGCSLPASSIDRELSARVLRMIHAPVGAEER